MSEFSSVRRALADSPWFWAHLFCVAGLVAMFLMQPKFGSRQSQLERQFQGRQHATQLPADQQASKPFSDEKQTIITLGPMVWLLAAAAAGTWGGLWWTHFRPKRQPEPGNSSRKPSTS